MFLSLDVQTQQRKHITKCTKVQRRGQSRSVSPVMPPSSGNSISFVVRHWWPLTDQRAAGCHGDAAPFLTHWQKAGLTYSAHFIVFYPHCIVFCFFLHRQKHVVSGQNYLGGLCHCLSTKLDNGTLSSWLSSYSDFVGIDNVVLSYIKTQLFQRGIVCLYNTIIFYISV